MTADKPSTYDADVAYNVLHFASHKSKGCKGSKKLK